MKKLFLFAAFAAFAMFAQAQFGVKGGINIANFSGSTVDDLSDQKSSVIGPYFGVFYNAKIADQFSIQPELVYSGQGSQLEEGNLEIKYQVNYLNFTPLVRWNSPSGFFLGTAPQIGFRLSAKIKYMDQEEDIKDDVKSTDFSWAFATGYELKSGLGFYARYNLGLASIAEDEDEDIKNSVFQVGLRYGIMPSKKGKGDSKK